MFVPPPPMKPPKTLTVITDTREKTPIPFPKQMTWGDHRGYRTIFSVKSVPQTLTTGDYAIDSYESIVLVERKGSIRELAGNTLSKDKARFARCLDRLGEETKYPYLLLDFPVTSVNADRNVDSPWLVMDRLYRACHHRGIRVWWISTRTVASRIALGEQLLRLMWNHVWEDLHGM